MIGVGAALALNQQIVVVDLAAVDVLFVGELGAVVRPLGELHRLDLPVVELAADLHSWLALEVGKVNPRLVAEVHFVAFEVDRFDAVLEDLRLLARELLHV